MKQVNASHYSSAAYVSKARFASYWRQVSEVLKLDPRRVLEIGPGPGIVTHILRKAGLEVTTVDYANDVGADVVASVLDLPFGDRAFDVVLCSQVLEHLAYSQFQKALREICRVTDTSAIISLPNSGKYVRYSLYVPIIGNIRFGVNVQAIPRLHVFDGQHHWEIGKAGFPLRKVRAAIKAVFPSVADDRFWDNPYHHFFVCRKDPSRRELTDNR
jgi:ubiquinone/menaquinone biosynthesis C-methylase UbiE